MQESPTYEQETYRPNGKLTGPSAEAPTPARSGVKPLPRVLYAVVLAAAGVFAWYVWPTPYENYQQNGTTIRSNRFTGETQTLQATGWVLTSTQAPQALDVDLLKSLSVDASVINRGTLHTRLYNGTNDRLDSVILDVKILDKDRKAKMERTYLLHPEDAGDGGAYGESGFAARCNMPLQPGETFQVAVAGASGAVIPGLASVNVATSDAPVHPATASAVPVLSAAKAVAPVVAKAPVAKAPKPAPPIAPAPEPVHSMPLTAGVTPPHPVAPFQSAIVAPRSQSLPKMPSAVSPSVLADPVKTAGLTPLQISSLQQRYDTYKRNGAFETDPKVQAWGLAALARNLVHDEHKPDLSKVPTSVLEDSLHLINTYTPQDFLR